MTGFLKQIQASLSALEDAMEAGFEDFKVTCESAGKYLILSFLYQLSCLKGC